MSDDPSPGTRPFGFYRTFAEMVDELAKVRGFHQHKQLARAIKGVDVSDKNVGNWRRGAHLPSAGFLQPLADALKVTGNAELEVIWNRLYAEAVLRERTDSAHLAEPSIPTEPVEEPLAPSSPPNMSPRHRFLSVKWIGLAIVFTIGVTAIQILTIQAPSPLPNAGLSNPPQQPTIIEAAAPVQTQQQRIAAAFSQLDIEQLVVIGNRNAPVKAYAIVSIINCSWCRNFMASGIDRLEEEFITPGRLAIVILPYWGGDWQESPDFEVHYASLCAPLDMRAALLRRLFFQGSAVVEDRARAYNAARQLSLDPPGMLSCLGDQERRQRVATQTFRILDVAPGQAARVFIDGEVFSVLDTDGIANVVRDRLRDLPSPH